LADLIQKLNEIAGKHGVGRIDHVENRLVGIKSREIYECPGAVTLLTAHKEIEDLTLVREVAHFKPIIENEFLLDLYPPEMEPQLFITSPSSVTILNLFLNLLDNFIAISIFSHIIVFAKK